MNTVHAPKRFKVNVPWADKTRRSLKRRGEEKTNFVEEHMIESNDIFNTHMEMLLSGYHQYIFCIFSFSRMTIYVKILE